MKQEMKRETLINVNAHHLSLGFNLREPRANKCTQVYAVVRYGKGKHLKFPLGKINSWDWDGTKEIPIFREGMNAQDGANSLEVLQHINRFRFGFYNYYHYLCTVGALQTTTEELRKELNARTAAAPQTIIISEPIAFSIGMNKPKKQNLVHRGGTKKATTMIKKAFEDYQRQRTLAEGTLKTYKQYVEVFCDYCKEKGDSLKKRLSQSGIEEYQQFLIDRGDSNNTVNRKTECIVRLVNGILNKSKLGLTNINTARLNVRKKEAEEKVRRPLSQDEVRKLQECQGLKPRQREWADLFLLQIYCGVRASDLHRLFDYTKHKVTEKEGKKLMTIKTTKSQEKQKAQIIVTPQMQDLLNRYSGGFRHVKFGNVGFDKLYNENIKRFAKQAGLDKIETFVEDGKQTTAPLHTIISSHFARYTFVHQKIAEGYTPEQIAPLTGHADGTQIRTIYGVLDDEERNDRMFETIANVEGRKVTEQTKTVTLDEIKVYQDVLRFFGCPYEDFKNLTTSEDLFSLIVERYEIPLKNEYTRRQLKEVYNTKNWPEQDKILKILFAMEDRIDGK